MAYTTSADVEDFLGQTLTAGQLAQADALIPAADAWIDGYTGHAWNTSSAITGEQHTSPGPLLYLKQKPVTSITTVTARDFTIGATPQTLTAGRDYELITPARGIVNLAGWWRDRLLSVTYVPAVPLDPRIALASTKIVAAWLGPLLGAVDTSQIAEYSIGQELTVKYRDAAASGSSEGIPGDVLTLLAPLRTPVFA